jgi:hypothetical protein
VTTGLERQLVELAARLEVDPRSTFVDDVLGRLDAPTGRGRWHSRALATAAALVLVVGAVLAVPHSRRAVARFFGIGSTRIEPMPGTVPGATADPATATSAASSAPSESTSAPAESTPATEATAIAVDEATFPTELDLGTAVDATRAAADTSLPVPIAPGLAPPSGIFAHTATGPAQVIVVYPPGEDLPPSRVAGVGALLSTTSGHVDSAGFVKFVDPGTVVELVDVHTATGEVVSGIWLGGTPHVYLVDREGDGSPTQDTLRLATNTLLWQVGGTVYRFESALERESALAIAATVVDANAASS